MLYFRGYTLQLTPFKPQLSIIISKEKYIQHN